MEAIGLVGHTGLAPLLTTLCVRRGVAVRCWLPDGEGQAPEGADAVALDALREVPLVFFCVPMARARATARRLGDVLHGAHVIVHGSWELEPETLATVSQILAQETPTRRHGVLAGPLRDADVSEGSLAAAAAASRFPEVHELLNALLVSPTFRLYRSQDVVGVELVSAYVKALAFVGGVAEGMGMGAAIKATLFARGLAEMSRFVAACGGEAKTAFGLAGAGALYAELHAPGSLAMQLGQATVARGSFEVEALADQLGPQAHGVFALMSALHQRASGVARLHIFEAAHAIIARGVSTPAAVAALMNLPVLDD